jgi:hypothetical protein
MSRPHRYRGRRSVLAVCAFVAVLAPIVIWTYPLPDVAGGWCQSGGRPRHYRVETVTAVAWWSDVVAVLGAVGIVASIPRSWAHELPWVWSAYCSAS